MIIKFNGIDYITISKAEYDSLSRGNVEQESSIMRIIIWDGTYYFKKYTFEEIAKKINELIDKIEELENGRI